MTKITTSMMMFLYLNPGVTIANDEKESEGSRKWSDRALMNKYGKITAIGIKEESDGRWIQKIRARCLLPPPLIPPSRYGREEEGWSQWRKVNSSQYPMLRIHQVELTSSTKLSSYSDDRYGELRSLAVTNLDNGVQQVFGFHKKDHDYLSLRESPPLVQSSLAFTHFYGVEEDGAYSVCFNIE